MNKIAEGIEKPSFKWYLYNYIKNCLTAGKNVV